MRIVFIIILAFICGDTNAQHSALYSQYMFNGFVLNPAYAGSQNALSLSTFYRSQWSGLEGSPQTFGFTAHSALRNKASNLGLLILNDKTGFTSHTRINGAYAYRIRVNNAQLSFGIQGGISSFRFSQNEIRTTDPGDPSFTGMETKILPEAGFGIYYYNKNLFAGLSAPVLFSGEEENRLSGKTYILYAGGVIKLNESVQIKPASQLKYLKHSPLQAEISTMVYLKKIFGAGLGYRTSDALILFLDLELNDQLRASYTYDYTLSLLKNYSKGAHEVRLRYLFGYKVNPQSSRHF